MFEVACVLATSTLRPTWPLCGTVLIHIAIFAYTPILVLVYTLIFFIAYKYFFLSRIHMSMLSQHAALVILLYRNNLPLVMLLFWYIYLKLDVLKKLMVVTSRPPCGTIWPYRFFLSHITSCNAFINFFWKQVDPRRRRAKPAKTSG